MKLLSDRVLCVIAVALFVASVWLSFVEFAARRNAAKAPAQVEAASPEPCCGGGCRNEIPPEAGMP